MDAYMIKTLEKMLSHEEVPHKMHYGAQLSHWYGDTQPITIDAGGLRALIAHYSGSVEKVASGTKV